MRWPIRWRPVHSLQGVAADHAAAGTWSRTLDRPATARLYLSLFSLMAGEHKWHGFEARSLASVPQVGWLVDTTPLRVSADFRRLWVAQAISFAGSTMTMAALPYQIFRLTHSSLDVGLFGLAQLVPLLVFAVLGGVLADRHDKRSLLLLQTVASLLLSACLAFNASVGHPSLA